MPDAKYYVQDTRSVVGNCGSWWAPKGAGYVCNIDDAGTFTGVDVATMRDTDVPWPVAHVLEHAVRHVRVDTQAFNRNDDVYVEARKQAEAETLKRAAREVTKRKPRGGSHG